MRKVQDFWLPAAGRQAAGSSYFCSGVFGEPAGGHREHSAPNGHLKDVAAPKPMDVGLLGGRWGTLVGSCRMSVFGGLVFDGCPEFTGSPRLSPREPSKDRNNININIDVSNIMNPAFLLGIAFNIV